MPAEAWVFRLFTTLDEFCTGGLDLPLFTAYRN